MDNEILIVLIFVGGGVLSYVLVPGLIVIWDRVLDYVGGKNDR